MHTGTRFNTATSLKKIYYQTRYKDETVSVLAEILDEILAESKQWAVRGGPCGSGGWGAGVPTVPQGKPLAWRLKEGGVQAGLAWPVEGEGPVALRPPGLATLPSEADPHLGRHGGRGAGGPARSHT